MSQTILPVFCLLLATTSVQATNQLDMSADSGVASATAANYLAFQASAAWASSRTNSVCGFSTGGTLSNLRVTLATAPQNGAGTQSYAYAALDGTTVTALTCTVSEDATSCTDVSNTATVTAADEFTLRSNPAGTPVTTRVTYSLLFDGSTTAESNLCGSSEGSNLPTGSTDYLGLGGSQGDTTTEQVAEIVIPTSGTIKLLDVKLSGAPGVSKSYTFTVRKNAADTSPAITCAISGNGSTSCSDATTTATVVAGDRIAVSVVPAGTPTARIVTHVSVVFLADTTGYFIVAANSQGNATNSATSYLSAMGAGSNATETENDEVAQAFTVSNVYVNAGAAPGAGKSWQMDFRVAAIDSGPTCTISDSATTCNNSTSVALSNDQKIGTELTPSGTPTATGISVSYLFIPTTTARRVYMISQEERCGRLWPFCFSRN